MGTNFTPLLTDIFLFSYQAELTLLYSISAPRQFIYGLLTLHWNPMPLGMGWGHRIGLKDHWWFILYSCPVLFYPLGLTLGLRLNNTAVLIKIFLISMLLLILVWNKWDCIMIYAIYHLHWTLGIWLTGCNKMPGTQHHGQVGGL